MPPEHDRTPLPAHQLEEPENEMDISTWFSLSYSNHLVLHRVELEHMPLEWQQRFVNMLQQLESAYEHLPHPEGYQVFPCRYVSADTLSMAEKQATGVSSSLDHFPEPPENATEEQIKAYESAWAQAQREEVFYDGNGNEIDGDTRIPVRTPDPLPHYRHGRVEPRLP